MRVSLASMMTTIPVSVAAFCLAAAVTASQTPVASQTPTGFSGNWKLDVGQSTSAGGASGQRNAPGAAGSGMGLGPSPDQLVITETAAAVTIEEHRGAAVAKIVLPLDGKPGSRTVAAGRSSGAAGTSVTKWADGRLTTMVTLPGAGGAADLQYEEIRYLDLGFLIVEIRQVGAPGVRRLAYARAK